MSDSMPGRDAPSARLRWLPAMLLIVAFMVHLPTLGAPLVDRHPFRQTQTAYTARIFHEEGIDLLHPKLPVLGAPWQVPFEFPAYQAAAAIVMEAGVPEDTALRLTGLVSFLLAGGLLWLLVARQVGWLGGTAALGIFLFSTLGISWGRAAMIEYTALAASFGFALCGLRWRARASGPWFALALALGCLAMMVKITTAVFWVVPFVVLAVSRDDDRQTRTSWTGAGLLSVIPLVAGLAWTRWADAIKVASDATAWLTSIALASWNTGTMAQRLEADAWAAVASSAIFLAGGIALPFVAWPAIRLAVALRQIRFWVWVGGTVIGPILVFFNLYVVHDYYSIAVSGSVAALVGLGVAGLPYVQTWLRGVLITGAVVAWAAVWWTRAPYLAPTFDPTADPEGVLPLAAQIERETDDGDLVAIIGRDWTPEILYYAHRWGWMVTGREPIPIGVDEVRDRGYVIYQCPWGAAADTCVRLD